MMGNHHVRFRGRGTGDPTRTTWPLPDDIGGKRRKGQRSKRDDEDDQPKGRAGTRKMMAVTAVERGGRAKAHKGKTHSERTIARTVYDWTDRDDILVTDELPAYRWIGRKFRAHLRVNHSTGEWIRLDPYGRGIVHTCAKGARQRANTVESFNATICTKWTPLHEVDAMRRQGVKRAIIGVWHWLALRAPSGHSIKHSDRYLGEIAARWNWRGMDNMDRFDIALRGLFESALPWKALTA